VLVEAEICIAPEEQQHFQIPLAAILLSTEAGVSPEVGLAPASDEKPEAPPSVQQSAAFPGDLNRSLHHP
jgi:hypothetical protein